MDGKTTALNTHGLQLPQIHRHWRLQTEEATTVQSNLQSNWNFPQAYVLSNNTVDGYK